MPPPTSLPLRGKRLRAPSLRLPHQDDESTKLLAPLLDRLSRAINSISHDDSSAITLLLDPLLQLRPLLASSSGRFKDDFRLLKGLDRIFELITVLNSIDDPTLATHHDSILQLIPAVLGLLSDALYDHVLNRQEFELLRLRNADPDALLLFLYRSSLQHRHAIRIFGYLLSCATHDDSVYSDFEKQAVSSASSEKSSTSLDFSSCYLHLPEFFPILLQVWAHHRGPGTPRWKETASMQLSLTLFNTMLQIVRMDRNNIQLTHTRMLGTLLDMYFPDGLHKSLDDALHQMILTCTQLGLRSLDEADKLFRLARRNEHGSHLLLDCVRTARQPPHILFDMSISGFSSLEFPELPHSFPPQDPASGYSFLAWVKVLSFDQSSHTTIFGAFDESQSCFVLIYIERGSHHLVLQTSVTSSRPSVRFKSVKFELGRWYHIALIQKRPKGEGPGAVALFVDGELMEHAKCPYPRLPASTRHRAPSGSFVPRFEVVQGFYGTPRDLSPRLGPGMVKSSWALASSHLFSEALPDDLVFVYKSLGPQYHGNFQDALGSFQTFKASAALNLRNEHYHPGKEDESVISKAVRSSASQYNPERNVILSVSPSTMLHKRPGAESLAPWTTVAYALNARAFEYLRQKTRNGANSLVLNSRTPLVEDALLKSTGTGVLVGPSLVSSATTLSDAAWLYSGCLALGLDLMKAASSKAALLSAVEIMFTLINDSWRNSEIAERENGFGMITFTLTRKLQHLERNGSDQRAASPHRHQGVDTESTRLQLLKKVLAFVGYDEQAPERSRIINPLAYRALLVDCVIWRSADILTQELYYRQFCVFSEQSRYKAFNIRRLNRMRIIKKLIESLKSRGVDMATKVDMVRAFDAILRSTSSANVYRSVALFITASLQEGKMRSPSASTHLRPASNRSFQPPSPLGVSSSDPITIIRGPQLGIAILEMLSESLSADARGNHVRKFAHSVTNKWLLHLLAEDGDHIAVLAMRILARIFGLLGPPYVERFEHKTKGFLILQDRLKTRWHLEDVWSSCFTMLFGMEQQVTAFDPQRLVQDLKRAGAPIAYPGIMPTMLAMLGHGLNAASNPSTPGKGRDSVSAVLRSFQAIYRGYTPFKDFSSESNFARDVIKIVFDPVHGQGAGLDPSVSDDMGTDASMISTEAILPDRPILPLRKHRTSSFVMVDSRQTRSTKTPALFLPLTPTDRTVKPVTSGHSGEQILIDSLCAIHVDQILRRKEFTGLGLFLKAPPAPLQYRAQLTSHLTRDIAKRLAIELQTNALLFQEPRVLNNLARFVTQSCEALFEGWLVASETSLLNFIASLLHYLETSEMQAIKSIRLCSPQLSSIRVTGRQMAVFALLINQTDEDALEEVLVTLLAMQDLLLPREPDEEATFRALAAILYKQLRSDHGAIRSHVSSLLRSLVAQKPDVVAASLTNGATEGEMHVGIEFCLTFQQTDDVESWLRTSQDKLDAFFASGPNAALADFVEEKNRATATSSAARVEKRKSRLEQWHLDEVTKQHAITEQDFATKNWNSNIFEAEMVKFHRSRQDQLESYDYLEGLCHRQEASLRRARQLSKSVDDAQWLLDESEGRDRMRLRLVRMDEKSETAYQPKRRTTNPPKLIKDSEKPDANTLTGDEAHTSPVTQSHATKELTEGLNGDDDFEVVAEPHKSDEVDQDKNRRVMRSLQSGEAVEDARNVSIIRGLEAQETLMIMGHKSLYLIENLFLKTDGEVVNTWDAPNEERDPYIKMISGQKVDDPVGTRKVDVKPKRWAWSDIVSISERQFLLRDVGLEIFFKDGRSYLATTVNKTQRDQISAKLNSKSLAAREASMQSPTESAWRTAILRASRDAPSSFGSKVAGLFNTSSAKAARRQWQKGEMSNFQYLMLVNSLAGRTFNDLTQYPVFPWVIADYTSEELDLSNPHTFRDLTKPMGCQTAERESAFRERYNSFAEMDPETPAFHYGTHYSSAMIVSSFLIRLQPFVKSYLLLQGGAFDHAERLFDNIEKAWKSASREGFTDIRELTPEFFYLPDFLVNLNKYNFGTKQSTGETINDVVLPKWAKGDPAVFVAKNREALESPHASQNLHHWIDLIFGFKQRGEPAIESTNVFHHLSYQGAKDLDTIQDERERVATIGIIHNFGQTPQQVFNRPHDRRDVLNGLGVLKLGTYQSLTRPSDPVTVSSEQVWHVEPKNLARDRRRAVYPPWRVPIPTDASLELIWGLTDQSLRLLSSTGGKFLHVREQPHSDQVSAVIWGEDRSAYSASEDGTIHAWNIVVDKGTAEIQQRGATLLGHRAPIEHLAISNSFGTLLSSDREGRVLTWSVSTLELVRCVTQLPVVSSIAINDLDGTIVCCADESVHFYTLNGRLLHKQAVCSWETGAITSCAWAKQESGSDVTNRVFASGHQKGVVQLWNLHISPSGEWLLDAIRQLDHESTAAVTYLLPLLERVYVGLEDGRLYEWTGTR